MNPHVAGKPLTSGGCDGGHFARQRAAVGVAQHHKISPGLLRCEPRGQRVPRVVLVAVERMLGVVDDFFALLFQEPDRVADHRQVFLRRRAQHFLHVQQPRLAKDGDHRRLGVDEQLDLRVVLGGNFLAACRAEGGNLSVLPLAPRRLLEKLNVLWVTPRPAAFHVVHTKRIELLGHAQLVRH